MFAIVDIETTGARSVDKITEIAVYRHDGEKIVDEFITLINPEISIPYFITNLTGINNEMVENAPKFYEVAKRIIEITGDAIFVAHNASFDYSIIKSEFKNLGYDFKRKTLCTVKLARKLIPSMQSYSLGKLCDELGIEIRNRHRAGGDALATTRLLEYLMEINGNEIDLFSQLRINSLGNLHPALDREKIEAVPEETGVYYFYNEKAELIYVGKSKNLYNRVLSHLSNFKSKKAVAMRDAIADISYEITGSELIALLLESNEIKSNIPLFNRSQRRTRYNAGLYLSEDSSGYLRLKASAVKENTFPVTVFHSMESAKSVLTSLCEEYGLCQKLCGLYDAAGACFHYSIKICNGACIGEEEVTQYNDRVRKAIAGFEFRDKNFYVIDKGRRNDERAIIKVANGAYAGFGYFDISDAASSPEELDSYINSYPDNKDVQQIIRSYLKRNKVQKIIKY